MTNYNLDDNSDDIGFKEKIVLSDVSPTQKLDLAKKILTSVLILALASICIRAFSPADNEAAKDIFETAKTILPAIATLVIGYYFGKSEIK